MKITLRSITSLAALLIVTGCNTVSISTNQSLGVPTFPPSNPSSIQILTAPPVKPHIRLGEIQAEPSGDGVTAAQITASLQKAAAKLGADAVVIVSDQNQVMGAMITGPRFGPGRSIQSYQQRVIIGAAIKYQ